MAAKVKDGVFIHVSHGENPHRVLMALSMADQMSEDKDVLVYFDIKGVEVPLKDAQERKFGNFTSSKTLLQKLIDNGVHLYACPACLEAAGKKPEDLMDGVKIADKQAFFDFTQGRILNFSY